MRVLLNALPAMIGADAQTYLYTNPLRQVRDLPYALRRAGDAPTAAVPPSHERSRRSKAAQASFSSIRFISMPL